MQKNTDKTIFSKNKIDDMGLLNIEKQIVPLFKFEINVKAITPIEFYNFSGIVLRGAFG